MDTSKPTQNPYVLCDELDEGEEEKQESDEDVGGVEQSQQVAGKRRPVLSQRMQAYLEKPSPQKQLKCTFPGCEKIFSSAPGLRYHVRTHCPNASNFCCQHCKREFKSRNGLKYHQRKTKCLDSAVDVAPSSPPSDQQQKQQPPVVILPQLPTAECDEKDPQATSEQLPAKHDETDSMMDTISNVPSQDWREPRHRRMELRRKQLEQQLRQEELNALEHGQQLASLPPPYRPPPLERVGPSEGGPLLEFANFATGPQSPLLRENSIDWTRPKTVSPTTQREYYVKVEYDNSNTQLQSNYLESNSPTHNVHESTRVCLGSEQASSPLYEVETLATAHSQGHSPSIPEDLTQPIPLCLIDRHKSADSDGKVELVFRCESHRQSCLTACCDSCHPFFVRNKGWASCDIGQTKESLGLPCSPLETGDVCLPPSFMQQDHRSKDSEGTEVNSLEYSSAIFLSEMAQTTSGGVEN